MTGRAGERQAFITETNHWLKQFAKRLQQEQKLWYFKQRAEHKLFGIKRL